MYLSNESNTIKDDSVKKSKASRPGQFGSMNPNLYTILIIIGIIQVLLIGYWVVPRAVSLYYQTRGGQIVDRVLSGGQLTQWDSIACASPPVSNESTREILLKAEGDLSQAIRFSPNDAHPQLLIGRVFCLLGEPEKAIAAYKEFVEIRPTNPLGHLELGFAYEAICQMEMDAIQGEARGRPEEKRCEIPEYQEPMTASWKAAGINLQDFIDTGVIALENERIVEALRWFRRGSEFSPDSGAPWFYIGKIYEGRERANISIDAYLTSFDLGYTESINPLVEIYTANDDDNALIALLKKLLERFPGNPERQLWWSQLGGKYVELKAWDSAILTYEDAIAEFPDNPEFHINLGLAYYDGGIGFDKAAEELERAMELDPDSGIGYYSLARILVKEKRYSEADTWFKRALEKNPSANWWQLARATAAREAGNLSLAQQEYLAINNRSPDFAPAYFEIALLYRFLEQPEEATAAILQAIKLMRTPNQEYYMRAASIYEWQGNVDKAVEMYRQVLDLNPEYERASQKLELLTGEEN